MTEERWKPVVGFEGAYEVSDLGRVRSLDRYVPHSNRWGTISSILHRGQILRLGPHAGGYKTVHLYRDGERVRATVLHIVVAEAFLGPRPTPEHEVRHLDGDAGNCAAANLAWGTRIENEADKELHGTRTRGEQHATAKLSEKDVVAIRRRAGEPQKDLADEFGCTFSNISAIQLRKSWRHV